MVSFLGIPVQAMLANGRPLLSHWEGISSRSANEDVKCRAEKTFHLPGVIDSMHGWQNFQSAFFTDMGAIRICRKQRSMQLCRIRMA